MYVIYLFGGITDGMAELEIVDDADEFRDVGCVSLPGYNACPGTARIISQRFGSLLNRVVRVFVKCDVQFFCFSINSLELNFRSGFSGFSGFSGLTRDVLWIFDGSRLAATPFPNGKLEFVVRFGDGVCGSPISPPSLHKLSSRLPEFFKLSATGRGARFSTPNFSNSARALLKRTACDSDRTTGAPTPVVVFWLSFKSVSISTGRRWKRFAICDTFGPTFELADLSIFCLLWLS